MLRDVCSLGCGRRACYVLALRGVFHVRLLVMIVSNYASFAIMLGVVARGVRLALYAMACDDMI